MKNAAPIAAKLHITKEELAALISVGVAEGFQPGEIGRGLKTVPMRLMAPSKDALAQMRAANIDMVKLYGLDLEKTRDTSPLERALAGSGLKITEAAKNVLTRQLTKADFTQGLGPVQGDPRHPLLDVEQQALRIAEVLVHRPALEVYSFLNAVQ